MFVISRGRIAFKGIDGKKMFCMFLKSMGRDRAQLLTLDLLLSLVPFVMVLGISANAMSGVVTQMQDYSYTYEKNRELQDAADALIKGPGIPALWHHNISTASLAGYASVDEETDLIVPNYMDFWKYNIANDTMIADILKTDNFNITVTLFNQTAYNLSTLNVSLSKGQNIPANATNIRKVERMVTIDNLLRLKLSTEKALGINNTERGGGSSWVCAESEFELSQFDIDNTNYWLFLNYSNENSTQNPVPATFSLSINEYRKGALRCPAPGSKKPDCNLLLEGSDFPDPPKFDSGSIPGFMWENKTACDPEFTPPTEQNVTYFVQNTTYGGHFIYMKVPKAWLIPDSTQWVYLWVNGYATVTTGWYVTAPQEIDPEDLERFFGLLIPYDDIGAKITLTVWDT